MSDTLTIPGLTEVEQVEFSLLLDRLLAHQPKNLQLAAMYDGKRAIRDLARSPQTVPAIYKTLGLVLGWSAKAVDMLARRCRFERAIWAGGDLGSTGYADFSEANLLGETIKQAVNASLIHGPAFLVNTKGGAGEPTSLLHVRSALHATGQWDARLRRLTSLLSVQEWGKGGDKGKPTSFALYLPNLTVTAVKNGHIWDIERSAHPWGIPAEVMRYRPYSTTRDFGAPRINNAMQSLQFAAIRDLIRLEGHLDVFSFPELWLLGADESVFGNKDRWQVMLGRIRAIPDDEDASTPRAAVEQFQAASPEPHLAAINAHAKLFAREADLPDSALAITDYANPTSADSFVESRENLISEAEGAADDWTPPLRRAIARGLAIQNGLGAVPEEFASIALKWQPASYTSRAAAADAGMKQLAALPWLAETEVGMELIGMTTEQIERAIDERRRAQSRANLTALAALAPQAATDANNG